MEDNKNLDTNTVDVENKGTEVENEILQFKKDEYEKNLQAEADRRVNQAKGKWEKEYQEKLKFERKEAERLARLSDDERQKEMDKQYKEQLSAREKELFKKEMKLEAINILAERKLPVTFSDILIGDTAEDTHEKIKAFDQAFRDEVAMEVEKRLKGSTPRTGGGSNTNKGFDMNALIRGSMRK
jgi:lysyl-tRNA synthetase class I